MTAADLQPWTMWLRPNEIEHRIAAIQKLPVRTPTSAAWTPRRDAATGALLTNAGQDRDGDPPRALDRIGRHEQVHDPRPALDRPAPARPHERHGRRVHGHPRTDRAGGWPRPGKERDPLHPG